MVDGGICMGFAAGLFIAAGAAFYAGVLQSKAADNMRMKLYTKES